MQGPDGMYGREPDNRLNCCEPDEKKPDDETVVGVVVLDPFGAPCDASLGAGLLRCNKATTKLPQNTLKSAVVTKNGLWSERCCSESPELVVRCCQGNMC